jgi:hypothetical protein
MRYKVVQLYSIGIQKSENIRSPKAFWTQALRIRDTGMYNVIYIESW